MLVGNRIRIKKKIRSRISGTGLCPRLSVFKSAKYIYAQLIDDDKKVTLVSNFARRKEAKIVGEKIAKAALSLKIESVVFDRNGYRYHGVVKNVADGARSGGLKF